MTAVLVQLEGQGGHPGIREGAILLGPARSASGPIRATPATAPSKLDHLKGSAVNSCVPLVWLGLLPSNCLLAMSSYKPGERMVREFVNTFLLVFAGLFPIINPLGNAPIFLTLTRQCTDEERHQPPGAWP